MLRVAFATFTRIAASDPIMWRDIAIANKDAVIQVMDNMMENLTALRASIEGQDKQALTQLFTRSREARNHFGSMLESNESDTGLQSPMNEKVINYIVSPGGNNARRSSCAR